MHVLALRVQVPNCHLLSQIVTYITTIYSKPKVPNYWVLWTLRVKEKASTRGSMEALECIYRCTLKVRLLVPPHKAPKSLNDEGWEH